MSLTQRGIKRVLREIDELNKSKDNLIENGIYFNTCEDNIGIIYAMIIGTTNTPYENGYYFFKIVFEGDYPIIPPKVYYFTQGGSVRFNPNLYVDTSGNGGKVCLSMINTWSGPGWVPTYTVINILMAIQALVLIDEPLRNEPGYTESNNQSVIDLYTDIIKYANIKFAILDMIRNIPDGFADFQQITFDHFIKNLDKIEKTIQDSIDNNKSIGPVVTPCYNFKINVNYTKLLQDFNMLKDDINNALKDDNNSM